MSAILSHAVLSSSSPPSTDCSASTECGGSLMSSTCVSATPTRCVANCAIEFCPTLSGSADLEAARMDAVASYYWEAAALCKKKNKKGCFHSPFFTTNACALTGGVAQDRDRDGCGDVRVEIERNGIVADLFQRSLRHSHHGLGNFMPLCLQRLGNVVIGNRAEQAAVDTSLLRDLDHQSLEPGRALPRLFERLVVRGLQFGAARLEFLQRLGGRALGFALRDQKIARESVPDLDHVAKLAQVVHFFHQDDLHVRGSP